MNRNTDIVLNALRRRSDDRGYVKTSTTELATDTALSRATVQRLIARLIEDGQIEKRSKRGQSGGLLIRLTKCLTNASPNASQTPQKSSPRNAFQETVSGTSSPETETVSCATPNASQTPQAEPEASWFVCCIWYDEKGQMWCHGSDGYDTYIPCATKEEAMEVGEQHARMFHKDKAQRYGVLPRVDICETIGKGKSLHYSYNALSGGRAP